MKIISIYETFLNKIVFKYNAIKSKFIYIV